MNVLRNVNRLLEKYGRKARIYGTGLRNNIVCFIQPMRYKSKMYFDSQYTKLGIVDESCFLYIGPAEYDLSEGMHAALVLDTGEEYSCIKTEKVYFGDQPIYTWAVLRQRRDSDEFTEFL